jgi:hypothetical protein
MSKYVLYLEEFDDDEEWLESLDLLEDSQEIEDDRVERRNGFRFLIIVAISLIFGLNSGVGMFFTVAITLSLYVAYADMAYSGEDWAPLKFLLLISGVGILFGVLSGGDDFDI